MIPAFFSVASVVLGLILYALGLERGHALRLPPSRNLQQKALPMKIIRSGNTTKPKEFTTECDGCDCKFRFAQTEAKFVSDHRDGDAYVIKCPECKRENWIAASLFR